MKMNKKGQKLTKGMLEGAVVFVVLVLLFMSIYAVLVPEAQSAGDALNVSNRCDDVGCYYNSTGVSGDECQLNSTDISTCTASAQSLPLSSLFAGSGVIFVVLMAGLLIVLIGGALAGKKK